ncbi:MAG: DHH family phosphoesterase, partial [Lachnospiraceae bacterium]|nr:DHH family phosphoesterase [Lachnospiraceae bacterium]
MNILNEKIEKADSIVILGHMNPDGDCLGSTLSIYNYIRYKYSGKKKVQVHLEDSSKKFRVLPGYDAINDKQGDGVVYDLCIICDCSTFERIKGFEQYFNNAKDKLIIDHHETNEMKDIDIVLDGKAPATCQIVYDLLDKEYIDKNVATCLYVGLAHDTGVFRYNSTTKHTMEIAGALMEKGIDFTTLLDETIFMKSYNTRLITAKIIERAEFYHGNEVIFAYTDDKELKEYGLSKKDIDAVVVDLRETDGV